MVVDDSNIGALCDVIKGDMLDVTYAALPANLCDVEEVKKVYKIKEEELMVGTLLEAVVNRISTKHIVAF